LLFNLFAVRFIHVYHFLVNNDYHY